MFIYLESMFTVTKLSLPSFADTNCVFFKNPIGSAKYAMIKSAKTTGVFKIGFDFALESEAHVGINTIQRATLGAELGAPVSISFL